MLRAGQVTCADHADRDSVWCEVDGDEMRLLCARCISRLRAQGARVIVLPVGALNAS